MHGMDDAAHVVPDMDGQRAAHRPDALIATLAARQHGVIARRQLIARGVGADSIDHRVERQRLHPVHRGVYAVGYRPLTREGAWMAAVLAGGDAAVLSHRSAAALWGIRETSRRGIELTAPTHRRVRAGISMHQGRVPSDEVTTHRGIPVTTAARTLLDLAALLDEHHLARAAERAEALRLASPTSLADLVARYPRRPGVPTIRRLVERDRIVPTTTANDLERRFLSFLDANALPRPLVNESLDPHTTPDFRWTAHRLIVELDGFETHGTRAAFERDRARDRALMAAGWRVARITKRQLDDAPTTLAAELRALLSPTATA
jgi:predicted transcriptional regulator of viral defense system